MILSCNNISKSFGTDIIIKSCSFNIEDHEKAAIVGINGAGKSTLLKIITGEEPADTGIVTLAKDKTLGYLAQQQDLQSDTLWMWKMYGSTCVRIACCPKGNVRA